MTVNNKTRCLSDIRRRILSLDLAPGSDLDETSLCDVYGISRTPLREVFQRLSGEGFVNLAQNKGAKVASLDFSVLRIFFQTAPLIYANISNLAAANRTDAQIEDLRSIQEQFKAATTGSDPNAAALWNYQFHNKIGDMAANPYLTPSLNRMLIDHTRLSQTFYRPASAEERMLVVKAVDQHDAMISAIEAGESALAIELTLQHWDLSRDRIERYVRPDPLPMDVISLQEHKNAL